MHGSRQVANGAKLTAMDAAAPPPVEPSRGAARSYVSPTLPNPMELGSYAFLALLIVLALSLPWLMLRQVNASGLNFDTWKLPQAGAAPEMLLPAGALDRHDTAAGTLLTYGDGIWAIIKPHEGRAAAVADWRSRWQSGTWPEGVLGAATSIGGGQYLSFASLRDGRLLEFVSGVYTVQFFAPDDNGLSLMVQASSLIDAPNEPKFGVGDAPLGIRLLRFHGIATAVALNLLLLAGLAALYFFGTRGMAIAPPATARKLGREALRTRLIALNTANSPLQIEEQEPYHLIARWKSDAPEMAQWLASRNLRAAWQLDIYLADNARANVLETYGTVAWDGRQTPPAASFNWNYLRELGQAQRAARSAAAPAADLDAVILPTQSINPTDYRAALRDLLLGSGWSWNPMLFRPLVWEYR